MALLLRDQNVNIAFGGMVFNTRPNLRQQIPGHFLGTQIDKVPHAVERLLASPRPVEAESTISPEYQKAHQHFLQEQAQLEARVWDLLRDAPISPIELARANRDFASSIIAALRLGDITYSGTDLHWVQALLTNYHYRIQPESLTDYISAYHQAAVETLDERGRILIDWLDDVLHADVETW
jgi:hypothetical protein